MNKTRQMFEWWRILSWILVFSFLGGMLPQPTVAFAQEVHEEQTVTDAPDGMGDIPQVGESVVSAAGTESESCYYTGVSPQDGTANRQNFTWYASSNAYYNQGVAGSPVDPPLALIQVQESSAAGGGTTSRMLVEARVASVGNSADRMVRAQLPAGTETIGQSYPNGNWQTLQWNRQGSLSFPQTGRLLAQGGSDDIVWVGWIAVIRCYTASSPTATPTNFPATATPTRIPPTSTPVPTFTPVPPTPTRIPPTSTPVPTFTPVSPTPTNTPSPTATSTPITDPVTAPPQGSIVPNNAETCQGVVYMPAVTGGSLAAAASEPYVVEVLPAGAKAISAAACMIPPTPHCAFQWDKIWDVIWTDLEFGDLWVCGDEAQIQGPVMVMATTTTTGTPADLLVIGGVVVLAGLQQWASYTIQNYDLSMPMPDGALLFESVEDAKNWIAGQFVRPVTLGSNPIRIEQYRESLAQSGAYNATVRWYSNDTSGTQFSVVQDATNAGITAATILAVQIVTGDGIVPTTAVNYRVERGVIPGAQTYPSVDVALGWVFATQVNVPQPVAEAPEVPHVANHPRVDERAKKIAGWRLSYTDWFSWLNGTGGKGPNFCASRPDGAWLIVFYHVAVQKTTGGLYKGVALILHWDGVSDSTVMTDVKPTDGDPNGNSKPKGPTFDEFNVPMPCPLPLVPAK